MNVLSGIHTVAIYKYSWWEMHRPYFSSVCFMNLSLPTSHTSFHALSSFFLSPPVSGSHTVLFFTHQHMASEVSSALSCLVLAAFPQAYLAAPSPFSPNFSYGLWIHKAWCGDALPEVGRGQTLPHLHISYHSEVPWAPRQYGIFDVWVLWPPGWCSESLGWNKTYYMELEESND